MSIRAKSHLAAVTSAFGARAETDAHYNANTGDVSSRGGRRATLTSETGGGQGFGPRGRGQRSSDRAPGETDLRGLIEILTRNLWKILAATALTTALALTYLALTKPVYTATAALYIDPRERRIVSEDTTPGAFGSDFALVESQSAIMMSDGVLKRVVDKLALDKNEEFAPQSGGGIRATIRHLLGRESPPSDPEAAALGNLAKAVKVTRAQKSYVVDLEASAHSPVLAARIADAVLEAYLADQRDAKSAEAKRINGLIDARLDELRAQVRDAEVRADDYKKANKIVSSDGGIVTEQQLTRLSGELATARGVAAESKARQQQIEAALKSGAGPEVLPDAIRSPLIQRLREQYAQVARREAALSSQLQSRHPVMIDIRSQISSVKGQIADELKRIAAATRSEARIASGRVSEISAELEKAKQLVSTSNTAQIRARELDQDAATSRQLLGQYLARAKETREQQNVATADARIITPPSLPDRPSKPLTWLVLALGTLGGLGLGLAAALISDQIDPTLRSAADVADETGLTPVLALPRLTTPHFFGRGRRDGSPVPAAQFSDLLGAIADTKSPADRKYRQAVLRILNRIKTGQRPGRPHTVMMTSPRRALGNSATTLALAYAAALSGDRVLLVDATSIDADLSTVFADTVPNNTVIKLDDKSNLEAITVRDGRSGLAFLPIALADLQTLKAQQRRRLIAGLNGLIQDYDLVFIDAGAVLEDESAAALLPAADQILIVSRAGRTVRGDIDETLELLGPAADRITATIMTFSEGNSV